MDQPPPLSPGTFIRHNHTRGYILEALPTAETTEEKSKGHPRYYWVRISQKNPLENPYKVLSSQEFEIDSCQKTHTG